MKLNYLSYRQAAKRLFNTEDGKFVLAYLDQTKVKQTAFGKSAEETAYKLGIKEFVQALINDVNDPRDLEELQRFNRVNGENHE